MAYAVSSNTLILFGVAVLLFFVGFAIHEPIMQSLASRYPKAHQKVQHLVFLPRLDMWEAHLVEPVAGGSMTKLGFLASQSLLRSCVLYGHCY